MKISLIPVVFLCLTGWNKMFMMIASFSGSHYSLYSFPE